MEAIAAPTEEVLWKALRLSIPLPGRFEEVVDRFERTIPRYPAAEYAERVARKSSWEEILAFTNELAPLGFLIYWRNAVDEMMTLAGDQARCVSYLMGNHTIAEQMYRYDPRVMNYAPLRVEITQVGDDAVRFTIDQPSTQFESFGHPEIALVGVSLDRKLAGVLRALEAPVVPERLEHEGTYAETSTQTRKETHNV